MHSILAAPLPMRAQNNKGTCPNSRSIYHRKIRAHAMSGEGELGSASASKGKRKGGYQQGGGGDRKVRDQHNRDITE